MDAVGRGDRVGPEIFGVSIRGDDAVARGEGLVHALDEVGREQIVGVEDEKGVEGFQRVVALDVLNQKPERPALAGAGGVLPLIDDRAVRAAKLGGFVRAVVGDDKDRHQPGRIRLGADAVDEVGDDGLLVARRDQHGVAEALVRLGKPFGAGEKADGLVDRFIKRQHGENA